jgi:hypothetical protein
MSFQLALVQDKNYPQNVISKGQTTNPVHISWALKKLIINLCWSSVTFLCSKMPYLSHFLQHCHGFKYDDRQGHHGGYIRSDILMHHFPIALSILFHPINKKNKGVKPTGYTWQCFESDTLNSAASRTLPVRWVRQVEFTSSDQCTKHPNTHSERAQKTLKRTWEFCTSVGWTSHIYSSQSTCLSWK